MTDNTEVSIRHPATGPRHHCTSRLCLARPEPSHRRNDRRDHCRCLRLWCALDHCCRHKLCKEGRGERHLPRVALSLADPDFLVCASLVRDRRRVVHYYRGYPDCAGDFLRDRHLGHLPDRSRVAGAPRSKADVLMLRRRFAENQAPRRFCPNHAGLAESARLAVAKVIRPCCDRAESVPLSLSSETTTSGCFCVA